MREPRPSPQQRKSAVALHKALKAAHVPSIVKGSELVARANFVAASTAVSKRKYEEAAYWADAGSHMVRMADEWAAIGRLNVASVVKLMRNLAKGEDRHDKKSILEIVALIEGEKIDEAYEELQGLDTFVRDLFPDDIWMWLWFNSSGSKKERLGCHPRGAHLVPKKRVDWKDDRIKELEAEIESLHELAAGEDI
jgi:hypothetical protein